jgi:hypothetical protein
MSPNYFRSSFLLLLVVFIISCGQFSTIENASILSSATPTPASSVPEYKEALADIWIEDDHYKIGGISIVRECSPEDDHIGTCELTIRSSGHLVQRFEVEDGRKYWLKYGILNLLGKNSQQLIVFTYSGGAHCCYDYSIYDLEPTIRAVYDSSIYDSGNVIGDELVPVDVDGDGISEFYRDVMAFDYWGSGGHALASFPPAVFAYDKNTRRYAIANKRFPDFVMKRLDDLLALAAHDDWPDLDTKSEYLVRTRFLYMVYAGQRDAAWKYFDENYRSSSGTGYQEQFKEKFKREAKDIFAKDPIYLSMYRK